MRGRTAAAFLISSGPRMGKLENDPGSEFWPLAERALVGRSHACEVCLRDPRVSAEHALLRWHGGAWTLQDLGSRNGTFVAGRRVATGERVALSAGDVLGFGHEEGYRLADAGPPEPFAAPVGGGPPILACNGLLALPDAQDPEVTVHRVDDQRWTLERAGQTEDVRDRAVVHTRDGDLRLFLPEALPPTEEVKDGAPTLAALKLQFRVSRNEEAVELLAFHDQRTIDLKVRTYHYMLLQLARAREKDSSQAPEQQGWVLQADLCRQLRCTPDRLYIDVFRLRRQFADAGVVDAGKIIERRAGTGLLRIGVRHFEVVPLR